MPLSKVERQVLELICDEHRQTRRGAKTSIVHVGMNAANSQQKARIVDVLLALKKRGMLVFGDETWLPTAEAEAVSSCQGIELKHVSFQCTAEQLLQVEPRKFLAEEIAKAKADEVTQLIFGNDRISHDLLNRCAAMNATLLAQARQANAKGDPDAWRDLHWLMETAHQLVALGGKA